VSGATEGNKKGKMVGGTPRLTNNSRGLNKTRERRQEL